MVNASVPWTVLRGLVWFNWPPTWVLFLGHLIIFSMFVIEVRKPESLRVSCWSARCNVITPECHQRGSGGGSIPPEGMHFYFHCFFLHCAFPSIYFYVTGLIRDANGSKKALADRLYSIVERRRLDSSWRHTGAFTSLFFHFTSVKFLIANFYNCSHWGTEFSKNAFVEEVRFLPKACTFIFIVSFCTAPFRAFIFM